MPRVEICPYAAAEVALAAVAQASASAEVACICRHADRFGLTVFEMADKASCRPATLPILEILTAFWNRRMSHILFKC